MSTPSRPTDQPPVIKQVIKEYRFPKQEDLVQLIAPNLIVVRYGTITNNESENTLESRWVMETFNDIKQISNGQLLDVLVDLSTIDSGEYNSSESNKIYRSILGDSRVRKVAVFGLPTGWQMLIDVLTVFVPHKLKVFSTDAAARDWLGKA